MSLIRDGMRVFSRNGGEGASSTKVMMLLYFGPLAVIAGLVTMFMAPHVVQLGDQVQMVERVPSQLWPLLMLVFPIGMAKGHYDKKIAAASNGDAGA